MILLAPEVSFVTLHMRWHKGCCSYSIHKNGNLGERGVLELGNPGWRGVLAVYEIQSGGGSKMFAIRRGGGGCIFFWNNPLYIANIHSDQSECFSKN